MKDSELKLRDLHAEGGKKTSQKEKKRCPVQLVSQDSAQELLQRIISPYPGVSRIVFQFCCLLTRMCCFCWDGSKIAVVFFGEKKKELCCVLCCLQRKISFFFVKIK